MAPVLTSKLVGTMAEKALPLDDISHLWPAPPTELVPPMLFDSGEPAVRPASRPGQRPVSGACRGEHFEAERKVAQLDQRLEALAREVAALAAATTEQAERLTALEKRVRDSMLLMAGALSVRPGR